MAKIQISKDPTNQTALSLGYEMVANFDNRSKFIFSSPGLYAFTGQGVLTDACGLNIPRKFKGSLFVSKTLIGPVRGLRLLVGAGYKMPTESGYPLIIEKNIFRAEQGEKIFRSSCV